MTFHQLLEMTQYYLFFQEKIVYDDRLTYTAQEKQYFLLKMMMI